MADIIFCCEGKEKAGMSCMAIEIDKFYEKILKNGNTKRTLQAKSN